MEFKPKAKTTINPIPLQRRPESGETASPTPARVSLASRLQRFTSTPVQAQRQAVRLVLQAAELRAQEERQTTLQRQALEQTALTPLPLGAAEPALLRQPIPPEAVLRHPQTPADWVTVMHAQAEQIEGRTISARESAQFSALQRQVTQTLVQGFRTDRRPAQQRQDSYAAHLVALQRHPINVPVARAVLGLIPPGERPALQRAVDLTLQREQEQAAQAVQAYRTLAVQRQLAELDAEATRPILERIQARRGGGSPLPPAVQRHLEQGLNHDLSRVRIHDDAEADQLSKGVNALAFTTGTDIFFQSGRFSPNTQTGLELLAHEVTHTVQQSRGQVSQGVDPDAGLEQEARQMGQKLSRGPAFGTRPRHRGARSPGLATQPHQARSIPALQRASAPPLSVQRFGLGDLKKLADSAKDRLSSAGNAVKKAASAAVSHVVKKVRKAVPAAVQKAQQVSRAIQKKAATTVKSVQTRIAAASKVVKTYQPKVLTRLEQQAKRTFVKAKAVGSRLLQQAGGVVKRGVKVYTTVTQKAKEKVAQAAQKVGNGLKTVVKTVKTTYDNREQIKKDIERAAGTLIDQTKKKATALAKQAGETAQRLGRQAAALSQKAQRALAVAATQAGKAARQGWNTAAAATAGFMKKTAEKINAIKESPRFKSAVKFIKEAGIQVAKVGAAIVVGGVVIAGAAALTAATGGLAGPALVMALFASGALGGAASQIVENALRGKKNKFEGISPKSVVTDGALGVALGPVAKVVGGVAKAIGRPILNVAGKGLGAVGRVAGKAAVGILDSQDARIMPGLRVAAGATGDWLKGAGRAMAGVPGNLAQSARKTAENFSKSKLGALTAKVGERIGQSRPAQYVKGLDTELSGLLRGVASAPARLGSRLSKAAAPGLRTVKTALTPRGWLKRRFNLIRSGTERLKDRVAVAGIRGRNAVSDSFRSVRRSLAGQEDRVRRTLANRGLNVDMTKSITGQVFNAGERALASMKTYVSTEARSISNEVRAQWMGSAGIGGVLRTEGKLAPLLQQNPALNVVWNKEKARAQRQLTNAVARTMRNEATAAGQTLLRQASRQMAASQLTDDVIHEYALRNASGKFITRATQAYQTQSQVGITGFDPDQNWVAQLPRMYATGGKQMWNDLADKGRALRAAGGLAGAAATSAGWTTEEWFKTYVAGAAEQYKQPGEDWIPGRKEAEAGMKKLREDGLKNVVTAHTGLIPEALGGKLGALAPYDRFVKAQATISGTSGTTVSNELGYKDPEPDSTSGATP